MYGKSHRHRSDCHKEEIHIHSSLETESTSTDTQGSTRVGQEAEGEKEDMWANAFGDFQSKEWVRQGEQVEDWLVDHYSGVWDKGYNQFAGI